LEQVTRDELAGRHFLPDTITLAHGFTGNKVFEVSHQVGSFRLLRIGEDAGEKTDDVKNNA
jgi:hypothetical protein